MTDINPATKQPHRPGYQPKGKPVERHRKLGRAEQYAQKIAERRADGEQVKSPSANRKRRKHGR